MGVSTIENKRVRCFRSIFRNNKSGWHFGYFSFFLLKLLCLFAPCFQISLRQFVSCLLAILFDTSLNSLHFSTGFLKPTICINCNIFRFCRCHFSFRKWLLDEVWIHLPIAHRRDVLKECKKRVVIFLKNWVYLVIMTPSTIDSHCKKCFSRCRHHIIKLVIAMLEFVGWFIVPDTQTIVARCNQTFCGWLQYFITCKLFNDKVLEWFIVIE